MDFLHLGRVSEVWELWIVRYSNDKICPYLYLARQPLVVAKHAVAAVFFFGSRERPQRFSTTHNDHPAGSAPALGPA